MTLSLIILGLASLAELLFGQLWRWRRAASPVIMAFLAAASLGLLIRHLSTWTVLLAVISVYRCLNLARVRSERIHADYLFNTVRRTAIWLVGIQLAILSLAALNYRYDGGYGFWWGLLAALQLACSAVLLGSTFRHIRTTKAPEPVEGTPEASLPTLTVAIPARNETDDLETCLKSLIRSTYPKLEIIVLDDCSQSGSTPEIIRSFAHDGVKFLAGKPAPQQWLAKNYAYAQLAAEANGEILLFCGVDTRFEPESLTALVEIMLQKHKAMLSIVPKNLQLETSRPLKWLIQPSRYAWELPLPRRLLERPPVLSTCWLITRQALEAAGGFEAVRRKGVPESYLSRSAAVNDGYSFLRSDENIGVSCQKSLEEQKATAVRTRYLQLHRRPELVALTGLVELAVLIWPLILFISSVLNGERLLAIASGLSFFMAAAMYGRILNLTYRKFSWNGIWALPFAAVYDIGLLNYSMWQYEFGEVLWKGRNVCLPVMRVIPHLPKT